MAVCWSLEYPPFCLTRMLAFRRGSPPAFSGGRKRLASAALAHSALPLPIAKTVVLWYTCSTLIHQTAMVRMTPALAGCLPWCGHAFQVFAAAQKRTVYQHASEGKARVISYVVSRLTYPPLVGRRQRLAPVSSGLSRPPLDRVSSRVVCRKGEAQAQAPLGLGR